MFCCSFNVIIKEVGIFFRMSNVSNKYLFSNDKKQRNYEIRIIYVSKKKLSFILAGVFFLKFFSMDKAID